MANVKIGFDYFASETNRYQDIKIKRLKKEFKCEGVAVFDYILNEIYRVKGCYLELDDSIVFDIAEYWGLKESVVNEIINYCCHVGLFNKGLRANGSILTSVAIQKRYLDWSIKARRVNIVISGSINLLTNQNAGELLQNANILDDNTVILNQSSGSLPQSKVKESKVKESSSAHTRNHTATTAVSLNVFFTFFKQNTSWSEKLCKEKAEKIFSHYDWNKTSDWEKVALNWIDTERVGTGKKSKYPNHPDPKFAESLDNVQRKAFFSHLTELGWTQDIAGNWISPSGYKKSDSKSSANSQDDPMAKLTKMFTGK